MTVTIYLVRHGETALNASDRCQGTLDIPMNAIGEQQMIALADHLSSVRFDAAYTSPLQRARDSARILLGPSSLSATEVPELSELSYGTWQGTAFLEWPDGALDQWKSNPWEMEFPDGETLRQVRTRAMLALQRIVHAHPAQTVLVSAHGHVNRVVLTALAYYAEHEFWEIRQPNGAVWKLTVDVSPQQELRLRAASLTGERITTDLAQRVMDAKTKPLGALGQLEACGVRLAVLQQTLAPVVDITRVCVFAADHGVSDEGVSAFPRAVTAEMMKNFAAGGAAINVMARANDVQVEVLDVGVHADLATLTGVRHEKVCLGTRNITIEAAMSADELAQAMAVGAGAVSRAARDGVRAVGLGEMGIGNTTAASALLSALCGFDASKTVGFGTGVSIGTLDHKREVVTRAVALHGVRSDSHNARECLRRLGGLELAAIAGAVLESRRLPVAIVADGFIATVAVLCAAYMAEDELPDGARVVGSRVFLAHRSSERGHALAIDAFTALTQVEQQPLLDLGMRLGEGSGAALAMPLLRAAAAVMRDMATFASAQVSTGNVDEHAAT